MNKVGLIETAESSPVFRQVLLRGQADLMVWSPEDGSIQLEEGVRQVSLQELATAPLLLFNAPLYQCRNLARKLGDVISGRHALVHTIRGLEPGTGKVVSKILQEETPTQRLGFLTGPVLALDQEKGRPAAGVCGSLFPEVHDLLDDALSGSSYRVYRSQDLLGAEISSAYVRIIALLAGLSTGLEQGASLQAMLHARGLAEVSRMVVFFEGFERTTFGLSGLGNLHLDTSGEGSKDYRIGTFIAAKKNVTEELIFKTFDFEARELLEMVKVLKQKSDKASLDTPFLDALYAMVYQGLSSTEVAQGLTSRPALYE